MTDGDGPGGSGEGLFSVCAKGDGNIGLPVRIGRSPERVIESMMQCEADEESG